MMNIIKKLVLGGLVSFSLLFLSLVNLPTKWALGVSSAQAEEVNNDGGGTEPVLNCGRTHRLK